MSKQNEIMAIIQVDLGVIATPTHAKVERDPKTGKRIQSFEKKWVSWQGEMINANVPKKNKLRITEYISQVVIRRINASQFEYITSKNCVKHLKLKIDVNKWDRLSSESKLEIFFSEEYPNKNINITILE